MQALAIVVACLVGILVPAVSLAQEAGNGPATTYPSRAVHIIVPYAAGGPTDVIARIIAEKLSEALGQPHVVENHAGAGALIGTGIVARAAADGYTLLFVTNDLAARPAFTQNAPYDPIKSFEPVSVLAVSPQVIVVHPSLPVSTLAELMAHVRANPGKYAYGSPGLLTSTHLAAERLFKVAQKLDMPHVPFNGGAPAVEAVLGGHTMIAVTALAAVAPYITDGTLRALAITTGKRHARFPAVLTLAESGFAGQDSDVMIGVVVPAGTPRPIVTLLQKELRNIAEMPIVKARVESMAFDFVMSSPEEFAARINSDIAEWNKLAAVADFAPK